MSKEALEDMHDRQEIKRQKEEQRKNNEEMAKWSFGKGLKKDKDGKRDVRG